LLADAARAVREALAPALEEASRVAAEAGQTADTSTERDALAARIEGLAEMLAAGLLARGMETASLRQQVRSELGPDTTTPGSSEGTASAVGDFDGSRGRSRPHMVRRQIQRELERRTRVADAAGMDGIWRWRSLYRDDGRRTGPNGEMNYTVQPRHAASFTVSVIVGETGSDVARRVVDHEKRHVEITVSARAKRRFVGRALAHELAEATAALGGAPDDLDVLVARPDGTFDPAALSAHLRGRLAERAWLQTLLTSGNRAERARAEREIGQIDQAIGFTTLDPDARARVDRLLAEATLADADRAMLTELAERLDPTAVEPAAGRDDDAARDHSTHDEIWVRSWAAEGRRPGIGELITRTAEEAARWGGVAKAAFLDALVGVDYAGYRVSDVSEERHLWFDVRRDRVVVRLGIQGETADAGNAVLVFDRHPNGSLSVDLNSLGWQDAGRHSGFTAAFLEHLEIWATQSGADYVEVTHGSGTDGYAVAQRGYDWAPDGQPQAERLLARLDDERRVLDADAYLLNAWKFNPRFVDVSAVDDLLEQHPGLDEEALLDDLGRRRRDIIRVLQQARTHAFDSPGFPTPYEIGRAGWNGEQGTDATWAGKRVLQQWISTGGRG
ncbi:MAG TPA: hypothetical protein VGR21_11780, partial [Cryptosporangiaceae bacterium]|nr:hypothetical protein [Cryptosporangiaceae bacterium]